MKVLMKVSSYKDDFIAESIECKIGRRKAIVQLTDCLFKSQLGCEFIADDEFREDEESEIIDKAEDFAIKLKSKYKIISTNFNCAINGVSVSIYARKDNVFLVSIDDECSSRDYSVKYCVLNKFSSIKECKEYLSDFYTDEYHDFSGLKNLLETCSDD